MIARIYINNKPEYDILFKNKNKVQIWKFKPWEQSYLLKETSDKNYEKWLKTLPNFDWLRLK